MKRAEMRSQIGLGASNHNRKQGAQWSLANHYNSGTRD